MGNDHSSSRTNLGNNCTSFRADATSVKACWGDSLVVFTDIEKYDDHTNWVARYKIGEEKEGQRCYLELRARQDDNAVESINFELRDYANADNSTIFSVDFTRVGRDGFRGEITEVRSSSSNCSYINDKQSYWSYINDKKDYSMETTIVSYSCPCPNRDGLFVLQKKKMNYSDNAYMVTMAHYYVANLFGLCVWAEICHHKDKGLVVEFKGPFKHPSADLRRVIEETRRTGVWAQTG